MILVKSLTKFFGNKLAVNNVSFQVEKGEVLGFLGPNGAGKTTTMRMITGFLPPSSGTAIIGGYDIREDPINAKKMVGYLPENAPVYPDMPVYNFLEFIAEIRGFSGKEKKKRVSEIIEKCFLSEVRYQSIGTLSKGYRQRVCLAQSLLHDPEYLILDEPTDGLDPNQKHEVRNMIRDMAKSKAIILSTHILEEVDAVCTRAIIISNGRIMVDDTPEGLKKRSSIYGAIRIEPKNGDTSKIISDLKALPQTKDVCLDSGFIIVYPKEAGSDFVDTVLSYIKEKGYEISSFFVEEGRLDEVFRKITLEDGRSN